MPQQIVICVRFRTRQGRKEEFRRRLYELIETMKSEPDFINTIAHDDVDQADTLVLYETWRGTRESFMREQWTRPYRAPYEELVPTLLEERTIQWLVPHTGWSAASTSAALG